MSNASDFIIKKGILEKYIGPGGNVVIPEGVTEIGGEAFSGCALLTSVAIPDSVTIIRWGAFYDCNGLISVSIPASVSHLGEAAFFHCTGIKSISVPESLTEQCKHAFWDCPGLADENGFVIIGDCLLGYYGFGGDVVIPDGITEIGSQAFSGCATITSLTIPESVREISVCAFEKCTSLISVSIAGKETELYGRVFIGCANLTSFSVPQVGLIPEKHNFEGCSKLADENGLLIIGGRLVDYWGAGGDVAVPEGVTEIAANAFQGCNSLTSVTIPKSVIAIGGRAFEDCSNLKQITLPGSVTSIGSGAFYMCESLTQITIPNGVTSICDDTFKYCTNLKQITIPASVTSIGSGAFYRCTNLKQITIPDSVTSIGSSAFSKCESLTQITIPDSVTSIGGWVFSGCKNLTQITIPDLIEKIDKSIFKNCPSIHTVFISAPSKINPEYRFAAAVGFAQMNYPSDDPRCATYYKLIKSNAQKWILQAVNEPALLELMCREKLIPAKTVPDYIKAAQAGGNVECIAMLMDYNANKLTAAEKSRAAKKKESDDDTIIDRKIMRAEKKGIDGLVFVVTGSLETFNNRNELKAFITEKGGNLASSITAKVDYLILDDAYSNTEKKKKAEELGIDIITEYQFNDLSGRSFVVEDGCLKKYIGAGGDVTLPDSVTSIGYKAFSCCERLTQITLPGSVTFIGSCAFGQYENLTIHAPEGSYAEQYAKENNIPFIVTE